MARRAFMLVLTSLLLAGAAFAQGGGQLWLRSFEDRDGDGTKDANEPLLNRGISVNLLDLDGVVIASALLDNSPNAAQGLVGFQLLPPGEYTVTVTSADFTATGTSTFTTTVNETGVPTVLEFAAQPVAVVEEAADAAPAAVDEGARLLFSAGGAVAVVLLMTVVGVVFYAVVLRGRLRRATLDDRRMTTGNMRPVRTGETGPIRTTTGELRRPSDTGEFRGS